MAIEHISGIGNLTADPQLRYTNSGRAVCTYRIGATESRKNQDTGQWENVGEPLFVDIDFWDEDAEYYATRAKKGQRVTWHGDGVIRETWEKDGRSGEMFKIKNGAVSIWKPRNQTNPPTGNGQGQWGTPTDNPWAQQPAQDQQPTQQAPAQQAAADPWVINNNDNNNPPF